MTGTKITYEETVQLVNNNQGKRLQELAEIVHCPSWLLGMHLSNAKDKGYIVVANQKGSQTYWPKDYIPEAKVCFNKGFKDLFFVTLEDAREELKNNRFFKTEVLNVWKDNLGYEATIHILKEGK